MTVHRPLVGSDPRTWGPELPSQREYRLKKEKEAEDARKKTTWLQRMKQIAKVVGAVGVAGLGAYAGYKGFNGKSNKSTKYLTPKQIQKFLEAGLLDRDKLLDRL